jgi:predicted RNA-binding protein associated with RNAse of E/G family
VTTEVWNEIGEAWRAQEGFVFADTGYKWVTKWEEGKNHTVTEFIDATGKLVGAYFDIGSTVTKTPSGFEYDDWYLDVFQPAGERPVLLDENEMEQAVQAGFLTEEQAEIARREADRLIRQLEGNSAV